MSESTTNVIINGNDVQPCWNGYNIYGNPFDVIIEESIEYMRNSIFNIERYRHRNCIAHVSGDGFIEIINKQYEILDAMTDEEVELCRQKSILFKKLGNIMLITNNIFKLKQSFRTKYCECNPELDPELEKLFFGEDSSEYLKRRSLINIINEIYNKTHNIDEISELISGSIDVLDPNVKKESIYFKSEIEKYEKSEEFVKLHSLEMKDVYFMKSVVQHMNDDKYHITEKLFKRLF